MLEAYDKLKTKPKTIHGLKEVLQVSETACHRDQSTRLLKDFSKRLKACVEAGGGNIHSNNGILTCYQ